MKIAILYRNLLDKTQNSSVDTRTTKDSFYLGPRIKEILENLGHTPYIIDVNLNTFEQLRGGDFDIVFNLCDDGFRDNSLLEPHVPAMLDILEIPYTGSNFYTLATCLNKARCKEILAFHKIPTPQFQVFYNASDILNANLKFPVIVKPLHEDGSIGLKKESVVENITDLRERVDAVITNYYQPALVEKFISGKEVYVGILGSKENLTVLPISEVVFNSRLSPTTQICCYEAKWLPQSRQYKNTPISCPAKLEKETEEKLIHIAKRAYTLVGCDDYGRIDFRIDYDNRPYVLEVNPNPDISEDAGLAKMAQATGMSYDKLIAEILSIALQRAQLTNTVSIN
ncbi:MAG: ATP-grasp domain-containing protein [Candidatus Omnitrophota bacterium]